MRPPQADGAKPERPTIVRVTREVAIAASVVTSQNSAKGVRHHASGEAASGRIATGRIVARDAKAAGATSRIAETNRASGAIRRSSVAWPTRIRRSPSSPR